MEKEVVELAIVDGPDRFELATALLERKDKPLCFTASNYDYLLAVTISTLERMKGGKVKLVGTLQRNDGMYSNLDEAPRYNFSGVYAWEAQRGKFSVEGLDGEGFREREQPLEASKELVDDSVKCINRLLGNLPALVNDLMWERGRSETVSRARMLRQHICFIESATTSLLKIREILEEEYT